MRAHYYEFSLLAPHYIVHTIHALMRAANTKNGAEDPHYWISCHVFTTASTGLSYLQTLGDIQKLRQRYFDLTLDLFIQ